MLERYIEVIKTNEELAKIATILLSDKDLKNKLEDYIKHPYDADFFSVDNNSFLLATTTSCTEIKSIVGPELALTTATREAAVRLICSGAQYISTNYSQEPTLKMLGILKDESYKTKMCFQNKGDIIYIVVTKYPPDEYRGTQNEIFTAIKSTIWNRYVVSAHHINVYQGLFLSLIESSYPLKLGFDITTNSEIPEKSFLFGDSGYISIISVSNEEEDNFVDFMFNNNVQITLLGHVTKGDIRIDEISYGHINDIFV